MEQWDYLELEHEFLHFYKWMSITEKKRRGILAVETIEAYLKAYNQRRY